MCIDNNKLYTADANNCMQILDLPAVHVIQPPEITTPQLYLANYPNPFNPETTISYSIPQNGGVVMNIYNLRGQLVKHLLHENQTAGIHSLTWNGKNDNNNPVASGVYFCRISSDGKQQTRKMLLLK
jgi:hypothetical protein